MIAFTNFDFSKQNFTKIAQDVKKVFEDSGKRNYLLYGAGGVVAGAAVSVLGIMARGGLVGGTAGVALYALNNAASKYGKSKGLETYKIKAIQACSFLVVSVASIAALVALGVLGSPGAITLGAASTLWLGIQAVSILKQRQSNNGLDDNVDDLSESTAAATKPSEEID